MSNKISLRTRVQTYGSNLSNMVIPNLGAFIAWGLITAIAIPTQIELLSDLIGPMLTYLLPLLIAFAGGRMLHGFRGGVVGATAAMGVIVASDIPMFIGAMIMGPLGGWAIKKLDKLIEKRTPAGFELLINNFSAGILGAILAVLASLFVSPAVTGLTSALALGVELMITWGALPLVSIFIEPAKILFLNNAINMGILTPIATSQIAEHGKSILFLLESNPGPGFGILLAYMFFGKGATKASAYGAGVIHFIGGIHEIYFPYVLMKPLLLIAAIAGGMTGVFTLQLFDVGLVSVASPGSIIPIMLMTASGDHIGVIVGVLAATLVSFIIASFILRMDKKGEGDLLAANKQMEATKGKKSRATAILERSFQKNDDFPTKTIDKILFACDAGVGSSAMGASVVRKKLKNVGIEDIEVKNISIGNLPAEADIIFTHRDLLERAKSRQPNTFYVPVENFLDSPKYDEIVEQILLIRDGSNESSSPVATDETIFDASILNENNIKVNGSATTQEEAINEVADILISKGYVTEDYREKMFEREKMTTTYMGNHLAIPHGTDDAKSEVIQSGVVLITYANPINWKGENVRLVIGIAGKDNEHLEIISSIAGVCYEEQNVMNILQANSAQAILDQFKNN